MESSTLDQCPSDPIYIISGLMTIVVLLPILVIATMTKLKGLDHRYGYFMRGKDAGTLEDIIMDELDKLRDLRAEDRSNKGSIRTLSRDFKASPQKYGIIKYSVFKSMGGNLSFALSVLDYTNSGFVMNCVHSRGGCYLYMKRADMGQTDIILGNEEQEALEQALRYVEKN